jgi:hypothetical protein
MDGSRDGSGSGQSVDLRLRELGRTIPPSEIAELWVFPPLAALEGSAEFFLFTCFDGDRRRLYSACLPPGIRANGNSGQTITEHGLVPADRVPRMVHRLQRRLGDLGEPRHVEIGGSDVRWAELTTN